MTSIGGFVCSVETSIDGFRGSKNDKTFAGWGETKTWAETHKESSRSLKSGNHQCQPQNSSLLFLASHRFAENEITTFPSAHFYFSAKKYFFRGFSVFYYFFFRRNFGLSNNTEQRYVKSLRRSARQKQKPKSQLNLTFFRSLYLSLSLCESVLFLLSFFPLSFLHSSGI